MASTDETLWAHINTALVFYNYIYGSRNYERLILSRAKALGVDLDEVLASALPKLVIALHDIGKAYEPFQSNVRKVGTAQLHEQVSAYVTGNVLFIDEKIKEAVLTSIILHHSPMRGGSIAVPKGDLEKVGLRYSGGQGSVFKSFRLLAWEELEEMLEFLGREYGFSEYLLINKLPVDVSIRDISEEAKRLYEVLITRSIGPEIYMFSLLLLHPLIVCDNYSANINRSSSRRLPVRFLVDLPLPKETSVIARAILRLTVNRNT